VSARELQPEASAVWRWHHLIRDRSNLLTLFSTHHMDSLRVDYAEFEPGPLLAGRVVCLWTLTVRDRGPVHVQRVLPDGCMDIIWIDGSPPQVVGTMTRPSLVPVRAGTRVLGVRFHPGAAAGLLGITADAITDETVPLADLGDSRTRRLIAPVQEGASSAEQVREVRIAIESRNRSCDTNPTVSAAVAWLARNPTGRVSDLAAWLGLSARHLHRLFGAAVGCAPKTFHRVMRFQRALHLARAAAGSGREDPISLLAHDAGYADQPHMTRDFQQLAGQTPASLLGETSSALAMSDLFKT
jgi:AraC-like DNA-binding protein